MTASPDPAPHADQPYAGLTPHAVLDALDAAGLRGDGRILQLNSYENRVFQVHLEESLDPAAPLPGVVVAKFYRAGRWSDAQILEEHAFAQALADAEVPAVPSLALTVAADLRPEAADIALLGEPPTLAKLGGWRYGVSPRCGGRSPELEDPLTLEWIGRFLARLHLVGQQQRFEHRVTLDGSAAARASVQWLVDSDLLPMGALGGWHSACLRALDAVDVRFERHGPLELMRIHGDCHAGNVLWTSHGPHFVDLDDAVNGPAVQDLWMLLGGDRHEMQAQLGALLDGYETFREFDRRELALIEPLRTLRIVQHSAWIARRWNDPAFPIAFPNFESPSYWAQQTTQLHEQIEAMAEEPLIA
ncbi:serine/threonine protein kinase [Sphaerotilus montanus]|uniref:serine/threonine protein kinase n=1 Tax=Sphaerotilus montanus TaxID=522889 RepID=UPI003FA2103E